MKVLYEQPIETDYFLHDYQAGRPGARKLFHYTGENQGVEDRLRYLDGRSFERRYLKQLLQKYNGGLYYGDKAVKALEKMDNDEAVVVAGGQQAGMLTGPSLVISKALSVLKLADQEEKRLGRPVLPLFWIAGEDHDWEEVNHVNFPAEGHLDKTRFEGNFLPNVPVSEQPFEAAEVEAFVEEAFSKLRESPFTKELRDEVYVLLNRSRSWSQFFAEMMRWLFKDTKLIMMDPQQPEWRELGKPLFKTLLSDPDKINAAVYQGTAERKAAGYDEVAGINFDSGHLFYHINYVRHLLEYKDGAWRSRRSGKTVGTEKLLEEAVRQPTRFSTDVITRPLMQEQMLPVLHFVAGPGEMQYWSLLKPLFELLGMRMPVVQKRMEVHYVTRQVQQAAEKENVPYRMLLDLPLLEQKLQEVRRAALEVDGKAKALQALEEMKEAHAALAKEWIRQFPSQESFAKENWRRIEKETCYLGERLDAEQERRVQIHVRRLELIIGRLYPRREPAERQVNILFMLNEFGAFLPAQTAAETEWKSGRQNIILL
ncbi:bacillithiol biosynthesis cysteine-adding enzyme BshC [Marinococcus halophilus]|uniref:Putative cysteine ligase BshC n=1 Tax=Marinococcus halophilus TaxID=1371 RepID=A0A510Y1W6_MARHA|nr:bacillithiol biosynthesis cysteine-adding enzyme BshC [Marinococcus halophilus]OZT81357.1 bacillithiol biosynthesis cysteine-adding enzyme BshC [Marinococcus halophilus]GEK57308.1 putative cysteine ligase BshC [Marinococcus halophilus]